MSWATGFIERLKKGETVRFRPKGTSMVPRIRSGQLVTVAPIAGRPELDDVVLCSVNGHDYLHKVVDLLPDQALIGNNRGGINGWVPLEAIFGKLEKVEP